MQVNALHQYFGCVFKIYGDSAPRLTQGLPCSSLPSCQADILFTEISWRYQSMIDQCCHHCFMPQRCRHCHCGQDIPGSLSPTVLCRWCGCSGFLCISNGAHVASHASASVTGQAVIKQAGMKKQQLQGHAHHMQSYWTVHLCLIQ